MAEFFLPLTAQPMPTNTFQLFKSFYRELLVLAELSRHLIGGTESRVEGLEREYELSVQRRVDNRLHG